MLLLFAKNDWKTLGYDAPSITVDQRLKAICDLCQYLYPKRKAIQIMDTRNLSEDPGAAFTDEELDEM